MTSANTMTGTMHPGTSGWVVVTDRRHHGSGGRLPGCPRHEAVFNDPDETAAEYVAASVAAAVSIYEERLSPMGLRGIRLRRGPELVRVTLPATGTYVDGRGYVPVPLVPSNASQQWGQLWAAQGHQGVCTGLPLPPPAGTKNLWTCVFLGLETVLVVTETGPVPKT